MEPEKSVENAVSMIGSLDYQQMVTVLAKYGTKFAAALAIFIIGRWAARKVSAAIRMILGKSRVDATLVAFAGNIVHALVMVFVVIAALGQVGVQTASLAAMIAAIGLAIGMALQGSLSNVAAGVMLIVFRPFRVGDIIEAAGTTGVVEEVAIFTTRLRTPDNRIITVPNAAITAGNITNISARDTRRLDLTINVPYEEDLKAVRTLLDTILASEPLVLNDPAPAILVADLGQDGVRLDICPWVKTTDYLAARSALLQTIKTRFDESRMELVQAQKMVVEREEEETQEKS